MAVRLFFNAREWMPTQKTRANGVVRAFHSDVEGNTAEIITLGNWSYDLCEIVSPVIEVEQDTEYHIAFWINGGENDRPSEAVCQLRIMFDANYYNNTFEPDVENSFVFKLNKSYLKPIKNIDGWYLYDIPFNPGESRGVQMSFSAKEAPMSIMPAKAPEAYAAYPNKPDPYAKWRPCRHNIVWPDGWPANTWYSTEACRKKAVVEGGGIDIAALKEEILEDLRAELRAYMSAELENRIKPELTAMIDAATRKMAESQTAENKTEQ